MAGGDIALVSQPTGSDGSSMEISMRKGPSAAVTEAADVYGDAETVQDLGYVKRG